MDRQSSPVSLTELKSEANWLSAAATKYRNEIDISQYLPAGTTTFRVVSPISTDYYSVCVEDVMDLTCQGEYVARLVHLRVG